MTHVLYLGKITNRHLILVAVIIGYCLLGISKTYVSHLNPKGQDAPFKFHPIFFVYCMFFAECLYSIQQLVYPTKTNFKNEKKVLTKKTIVILVLLCLADMLSTFCGNLFVVKGIKSFDTIFKVVYFIMTCILMKTVMKYTFHKHHVIAISILLLSVIILTLLNVLSNEGDSDEYRTIVLYFIFSSLEEFLSSYQNVYEKYLMDIYYINPILIVGLEGVIGFTSLSIAFLPFKYSCPFADLGVCKQLTDSLGNTIYSPLEDFPQKIKDIFTKEGFLFGHIFLIFGLLSFNLFRCLTIFYYTPIHKAMANTVKIFFFWILGLIDSDYFDGNKQKVYSIVNIFNLIAYLLSLLGVSIFLELLMLGFQNLDSDTSDSITRRSILESDDIQTIV